MAPAPIPASSVLLLPGWLNSDPQHWQSRWERLHGYPRVEQNDWVWPRRGDWMARLDEVLLGVQCPAVLVAHSLGCQLVAAWATHSRHVGRAKAALLVAPPDTERVDIPPNLFSWRPIPREQLPFASHVVFSDDDPFCAPQSAAGMAASWGSALTAFGQRGHINADSGLGDWPQAETKPQCNRAVQARDEPPTVRHCISASLRRLRPRPVARASGRADLIADNRSMVTKKPKGLGLGLEALLGPRVKEAGDAASDATNGAPRSLKLEQLQPGKYQPRTRMDESSLYELAQSIKAQGVMQPILVRTVGAGRYEIIAGERRVRAAKLAGLDDVPVLIKEVADEAAAAMALIENIQREDLNPLEEAQGLKRLTDEFGLTHEQAAQAVGRSRSAASNLLRLLNLSEPVQQLLMAGEIDMGHARALLPLDGAQQVLSANQIVAKKLSVREAEKLVARAALHAGRQSPLLRVRADKPRDLLRIEQELSDALTAPVEIRVKKRTQRGEQGEVAIHFASLEELNGLLERLGLRSA